jgi:hypothetical protein
MILTRHFAWEVPRLLQRDLLETPESSQHAVCAGVRRMSEAWLTDDMLDDIPAWARLRVVAATRDDLDLLHQLIDRDVVHADRIHFEDGQALAVLPGFRGGEVPDRMYRMGPPGVGPRLSDLAELGEVRVDGSELRVDVVVPVVGPEVGSVFSARLEPGQGAARVDVTGGPEGATLTVRVDLAALASQDGPWRLVLQGEIAAGRFDVRLPGPAEETTARFWVRGRPYRVRVAAAGKGLGPQITVEPYAARAVAAGALRRVRR